MGTLHLVRHGQASFGEDDYDRLSALGRRQAVKLGEHWAVAGRRFDAILAGTLRRHRETLEGILEGLGGGAREHLPWPGLNEYDSLAVIASVHPEPLVRATTPEAVRHHFRLLRTGLAAWMNGDAAPTGMPAWRDFEAGVTTALDHVRANHFGGEVLMVTSGGPIATAVAHVLGAPPPAMIELNLRIKNTGVTEFAFTPKRHMLSTFNAAPHLDALPPDERATWITYT